MSERRHERSGENKGRRAEDDKSPLATAQGAADFHNRRRAEHFGGMPEGYEPPKPQGTETRLPAKGQTRLTVIRVTPAGSVQAETVSGTILALPRECLSFTPGEGDSILMTITPGD